MRGQMEQSPNRKSKAAKSIFYAAIYYIIQAALSFISRKVFLVYLGSELLGLSGLLSSVISTLSMMELGVGLAVCYSLYKPLAEGNKPQIHAVMQLFRKLYWIIGSCIFVLGLIATPFLPKFIETDLVFSYVNKVYILFLVDTLFSYLIGYNRNIIGADQKEYIVTRIDTLVSMISTAVLIAATWITRDFILYTILRILFALGKNLYIQRLAAKMYPEIRSPYPDKLDDSIKKELIRNVKSLLIINIASYCVVGTDNILLSKAGGLEAVAIYANYLAVFSLVNGVCNVAFTKIYAGTGNFLITNSKEDSFRLYQRIFFANFLITGFTTAAMLVMFNEFITLWVGAQYVWPLTFVVVLVYNNYSRHILGSTGTFISAAGQYAPTTFYRVMAMMEGLINLVCSILLIWPLKLGILGVFLGTSISTWVSTFTMPRNAHRNVLHQKQNVFWRRYALYLLCTVAFSAVCYSLTQLLRTSNSLVNLLIGAVVCSVVIPAFVWLLFRRTDEFQYFWNILRELIGGALRRPKYNGENENFESK